METNVNKEEQQSISHETDNDIGYAVFFSDSEDIAKAMAIAHIRQAHMEAHSGKEIVRPEIKAVQLVQGLLLPVLIAALSIAYSFLKAWIPWWAYVLVLLTIIIFCSKHFIIMLVLLYQKYAPARVRRACNFHPTCSCYMLMAIDKYGILRGVLKGIKRLTRCHPPNGGEDYP